MGATIVSMANHKGGVAKTASVANIGAAMASRGLRVLVADLDAQANLTRHFLQEMPERIVYHAIRERSGLPICHIRPNLELVPSGLDMAGVDMELQMMFSREHVLSDLLEPVRDAYDYILLDCPPALSLTTINALTASDRLVVPMRADLMSSYGLSMMDSFCARMQVLKPGLHIDRIFFTLYEKGLTMTDAVESDVRAKYGDTVLKSVVRKNSDVAKAAFFFTDVASAFPASNGAKDYSDLTDELLECL